MASPWALSYAREAQGLLQPAAQGKVRIQLLTDPWSVWCWGFEPVRRALQLRHPGIEFQPLVGGMFPRLPDPREVGFDIQRFFATVQRATGMPVRGDVTLRDRPTSTYPACIHVHAARLLAPEKEGAYLRALREAVYLDGENVSRPEVAAKVAERVGIGAREFREALGSGEPEREFQDRLAVLQGLKLHAYPTLLVTAAGKMARVEGFQALPAVLSIAESVSGQLHPPAPPPALRDAVPQGERVATREVAEALGLSVEAAYDKLRAAEEQGQLGRQRWATGDTWSRP
jgi:putative protein-disulfide isomerase